MPFCFVDEASSALYNEKKETRGRSERRGHVGVIKWLAAQALAVTGHDIERAAYLIFWLSGVVSAFVDNIPFVATMMPLIQDLGHGMGDLYLWLRYFLIGGS